MRACALLVLLGVLMGCAADPYPRQGVYVGESGTKPIKCNVKSDPLVCVPR